MLQDFAFTSNNIEIHTNKWNILQKSRFLLCKIAHLVVMMKDVMRNGISCKKKSISFLQDCTFTSINNETYTNKWNILQKKSTSFLQDCTFNSANGTFCKKSRFPVFARFRI